MRDLESEFEALGVGLAAVGLGDRRYAEIFLEDTGIPFPLFVDEDRLAYQALELPSASLWHLLRRDNARARRRAREAGFSQHRMGEHALQLGGSFLFGPGDEDLFAQFSETFGDTVPVAEVLERVRAMV